MGVEIGESFNINLVFVLFKLPFRFWYIAIGGHYLLNFNGPKIYLERIQTGH